MENGRVNFTMSIALDTVVLQFTALILTPQIQEAASEALDEDELENDIDSELAIRPPLSPRKPKSKPSPKRQATADLMQVSSSSYTSRPGETSIYNCIQIGCAVIYDIW